MRQDGREGESSAGKMGGGRKWVGLETGRAGGWSGVGEGGGQVVVGRECEGGGSGIELRIPFLLVPLSSETGEKGGGHTSLSRVRTSSDTALQNVRGSLTPLTHITNDFGWRKYSEYSAAYIAKKSCSIKCKK